MFPPRRALKRCPRRTPILAQLGDRLAFERVTEAPLREQIEARLRVRASLIGTLQARESRLYLSVEHHAAIAAERALIVMLAKVDAPLGFLEEELERVVASWTVAQEAERAAVFAPLLVALRQYGAHSEPFARLVRTPIPRRTTTALPSVSWEPALQASASTRPAVVVGAFAAVTVVVALLFQFGFRGPVGPQVPLLPGVPTWLGPKSPELAFAQPELDPEEYMRLVEFAEGQRSFAPEPRPLIPEPRAFLFESPTQNEPTKEEPESEGIFQRLSKLFDSSSRDEAPPAAPRPAAPSPTPAPLEQPRAPQVQPPEPQRQSAQQLALQPEQAQKLEPGPEQAQKLDPQPASPANPTTPASVPNATAFAYDVFGVNPGDTLNVRATPDHRAAKVAAILPTSTGLRSTGATRQAASATWLELILPNGTGWVNRTYLVEQPTLSASSGGVRVSQVSPVCSDPEVTSLVRRFMDVVRKADGRGLKTLVSPVRGLSVRLRSDGPSVPFTYSEVSSLFTSNRVWSFGPAVNRGSPVAGTFRDVVLPTLAQVVQPEPEFLCEKQYFTHDLKDTEWPRELTGLLPYGIQANEAGYTLRWVLGVEFVEGKPYVATLVRYVGTLAPAHVANPTAPSPTPAAVAPPAPAAKEAPAPPSAPASRTDSKPAEKAKEPEPEAAKKAVESQPADKSATSDKSEKSRSKKDGDEKKKKKK